MLTLANIGLQINNQKIFSNISLTLLPGSIYVLKGANGTGKTCLLKVIAKLYPNYYGKILWNNKIIKDDLYYKYVIGYLGHDLAIKDDLSMLDNLLLWADIKNTHLLLPAAISQFSLDNYVKMKCKHLSAGIRKRIALARIIISNTELWLLDEPETNLDEQGIELLLKLLQAKVNSGGIVLIASHDNKRYEKIPVINIENFK